MSPPGHARGMLGACSGRARGMLGACSGRARGVPGACSGRARGVLGACSGRARGEARASPELVRTARRGRLGRVELSAMLRTATFGFAVLALVAPPVPPAIDPAGSVEFAGAWDDNDNFSAAVQVGNVV